MPRWAGSPSALADEGHSGRPPISFAPPLPDPPRWWTRRRIVRHRQQARSPRLQIQRMTRGRRRRAGSPPALAFTPPPRTMTTHGSWSSRTKGIVGPNLPPPASFSSPLPLPPPWQRQWRPMPIASMATMPCTRGNINMCPAPKGIEGVAVAHKKLLQGDGRHGHQISRCILPPTTCLGLRR